MIRRMFVVAHGIDLVAVPRIARLIDEHGDRFLNRCFTRAEQEASRSAKRQAEHLAARFAAKEAVLKALGTGLSAGIAWTDIEVVRLPSGAPKIQLHNKAATFAASLGVSHWLVSLTHTGDYAAASVIGVSEG